MLVPSRWSLRTRLLALLLLLLTVASAAIVGLTALELRSYLVKQVDGRLSAVDERWRRSPPDSVVRLPSGGLPGYSTQSPTSGPSQGDPASGGADPDTVSPFGPKALPPAWQGTPVAFVRLPGQTVGTVAARIVDGTIQDAVVLSDDQVPTGLTADVTDKLAAVPADDKPHTVTLGALGVYRVVAGRAPDGSITVISGLPLAEVDATVNQLLIIAGAVSGGGVLLLGVIGAVTVRRTLRPLRRVAATAAQVAELPLDRGEVTLRVRVPEVDTDPWTEVGQVGAALNHMLGHVGAALAARHASETRVRQFVADASHELRTPLAAISGYAELTRRIGAHDPDPTRTPVPPEIAYAMSRVESETKRMTALVEDLLLLARLDSGRPLEHGCVDLSLLVVDVVSDAHVAAPGHRFRLDLPADPVTVRGDEARLHQVLANLLANARTHTPAGTTVTVALEVPEHDVPDHGEIRLAVTDDGPGIPAELLPDVFERFARGDSSRSRTAGSTGLGLAIVAAVVEAHGGRIAVTSVPGHTVFTVVLPAISTPVPPAVAGMAGALCSEATDKGRGSPGAAPRPRAVDAPTRDDDGGVVADTPGRGDVEGAVEAAVVGRGHAPLPTAR